MWKDVSRAALVATTGPGGTQGVIQQSDPAKCLAGGSLVSRQAREPCTRCQHPKTNNNLEIIPNLQRSFQNGNSTLVAQW